MTATYDANCARCGEFKRIKARGLCRRCYNLAWSREHPEVIRESNQRWREENPETLRESRRQENEQRDPVKRRAQTAVANALRDGKLERGPCEQAGDGCGGRINAHHEDYSKPLDVRWLCQLHHAAEHIRLRDMAESARPCADQNRVGAGSGKDRRDG